MMFKKTGTRLGGLLLAAAMVLSVSAGAFAAEPEAQIGNTTYATLWQALADVQNGQTIKVLRDITNEELTLLCNCDAAFEITIDLNGHTISESTTNTPAFTYVSANGTVAPTVTVKDGVLRCTAKAEAGSPYASGIWVESLDKQCRPVLVLQHMAISSQYDAGVNCIDAQLNVLSASINAYDDAIYAQDAPVYILSGSFFTTDGTDKGKDGALVAVNSSTISMTSPDAMIQPANWQTAKSTLIQVTWFEDVPQGSWYYDRVYEMAKQGIISGTSCWTFEPENSITRAEVVTLLAKASGQDVSAYSGSASFADVSSSAWYNHYIGWAAAKGVVSGYGYYQFGPEDTVTREQLAAMLLNYQTKIMNKSAVNTVTPPAFTDADTVSEWAQQAVSVITQEGIISGVGLDDGTVQLQPQANASRAQACIMLYQLLHLS